MRESVSFLEKPPNPRLHSSWLSKITFWYTIKVFAMGIKRPIDEADLSEPLLSHKASKLGRKIAKEWSEEVTEAEIKNREPKLIRPLLKCFISRFIGLGIILATSEISR